MKQKLKVTATYALLTFVFFTAITLTVSCGKQQPQLPSNKRDTSLDTMQLALQEINYLLAKREDSLLGEFVKTKIPGFKKSDLGFYYDIPKVDDLPNEMQQRKTALIRYKVFDLESNLRFEVARQNVEFRKKEFPIGMEAAAQMMRIGQKANFIIPWHLAYGVNGNEFVPPFTSVMVEMEILPE